MGALEFSEPRILQPQDDVSGFCCGTEFIDQWLATHGLTAKEHGTAVVYGTFISPSDGKQELAGFYSLSSYTVARSRAKGWLARNTPASIPVILLGMLGVDARYQGCGLGRDLLLDAAKRSKAIAEQLGAKALVVDPYDESARSFYERYGFRDLGDTSSMFAKL